MTALSLCMRAASAINGSTTIGHWPLPMLRANVQGKILGWIWYVACPFAVAMGVWPLMNIVGTLGPMSSPLHYNHSTVSFCLHLLRM